MFRGPPYLTNVSHFYYLNITYYRSARDSHIIRVVEGLVECGLKKNDASNTTEANMGGFDLKEVNNLFLLLVRSPHVFDL